MKSCEWFEWLGNKTCWSSLAIYLITDAVGNECFLIRAAVIIIVSLPVNLFSSFTSRPQIDCIATHTITFTCAHAHIHKHTHTHNYFKNMSGFYQVIDMFLFFRFLLMDGSVLQSGQQSGLIWRVFGWCYANWECSRWLIGHHGAIRQRGQSFSRSFRRSEYFVIL